MSNEPTEIKNAILILNPPCGMCGLGTRYDISIASIEAQDTYWNLQGQGKHKPVVPCACEACGLMYATFMHFIPIECAPFPCPKCGQLQNLEYKIQYIWVQDPTSFQFEAIITCKKCGNKKSFKEVLKKILGVLKITVGPTGVTVSKN